MLQIVVGFYPNNVLQQYLSSSISHPLPLVIQYPPSHFRIICIIYIYIKTYVHTYVYICIYDIHDETTVFGLRDVPRDSALVFVPSSRLP